VADESKPRSNDDGGTGCVVVLIVLLVLAAGGYEGLDGSGFVPHTRESSISAGPNWLVGESKTCMSTPVSAEDARWSKAKRGDVTILVSCDNGPYHNIKVTFWGKTKRMDRRAQNGVSWKCTKNSDSFICLDLD